MSTNNTPTKNVTFQQQNSRHNLIYDEDADTTIKLQDPEIDERDLPEVINNTVNLIDKTGEDKRISLRVGFLVEYPKMVKFQPKMLIPTKIRLFPIHR